jgi:hypothetical protein
MPILSPEHTSRRETLTQKWPRWEKLFPGAFRYPTKLGVNGSEGDGSLTIISFDHQGTTTVGSAQRLSNGNFHFTAGAVFDDLSLAPRAIEVTPEGKVVYALEANGAAIYRSYRVADLYTPPGR